VLRPVLLVIQLMLKTWIKCPIWIHVNKIKGSNPFGGNTKSECKFCEKVITGGAFMVNTHQNYRYLGSHHLLLHVKGIGVHMDPFIAHGEISSLLHVMRI
jgi:hypothetical protein